MTWEYKIVRGDQYLFVHDTKKGTLHLEEVLNGLGQEGWELVSTVSEVNVVAGTTGVAAFLKRPKG